MLIPLEPHGLLVWTCPTRISAALLDSLKLFESPASILGVPSILRVDWGDFLHTLGTRCHHLHWQVSISSCMLQRQLIYFETYLRLRSWIALSKYSFSLAKRLPSFSSCLTSCESCNFKNENVNVDYQTRRTVDVPVWNDFPVLADLLRNYPATTLCC